MSLAHPTADRTDALPAPDSNGGPFILLPWAALILSVCMIAAFLGQVLWAKVLITPWYLPIGGTVAALLAALAVNRRGAWWRILIAAGCVAIAALEWYFLLGLTILPDYSGPVTPRTRLPEFKARLADGTEISDSYFRQGRPAALVFFQGRWCPFCMTHLEQLEAHHAEFDRAGADIVVVSIEDVNTAAQTQADFPHLKVLSDERRELSDAVDVINKHSSPDGGDSAVPTILLIDGGGTVQWLHRPARFIARPSASELAAGIENMSAR